MENNEKFLSLEWFKSKVEKSIEKVIEKRIDELIEGGDNPPIVQEKLYLSMKLVNDSLIVVMRDGTIFTKPNATERDFGWVQSATSIDEIIDIIEDVEVAKEGKSARKEANKLKALSNGINILKNLNDFVVKENSLYLKGTSRTIPELLVNKFAEVVNNHNVPTKEDLEKELLDDEEYQGLKNFFMWCCLNPRAEVADSLYGFLSRNSFRITKQGFFVALRNVVTINTKVDNELLKFVSNANNKVKAVWKKNPANFCVLETDKGLELRKIFEDKDYIGRNLGNLAQLYKDLPNMEGNRFTDAHTRTFDIRVGQLVNMPLEKCNWNTADCGHAGLHFTADEIHYVGCGDTSVLILINPMKVVGIGESKGRCYEYLPIMTVPRNEATSILHDVDFDTLQLDEEYAINELNDLANRAKSGFTTEASKYSFNMPAISSEEINSIVNSLEAMKEKITNRVSNID